MGIIFVNEIILLVDLTDRQQGRFAGFSLYISDNGHIQGSKLCYKNGPVVPVLNFSTTCINYKRYVIFYNERNATSYPEGYVSSVVFTELCEVKVQGNTYYECFAQYSTKYHNNIMLNWLNIKLVFHQFYLYYSYIEKTYYLRAMASFLVSRQHFS